MRVISIKEFDEYCKGLNNACYVFSTDNQQSPTNNTLHISLRFNQMFVALHPNVISLCGERSRITMRNVKHVCVFDDTPSIGVRIDIICREYKKDIVYTFLID